jgi:class 3 adenylate cyclase
MLESTLEAVVANLLTAYGIDLVQGGLNRSGAAAPSFRPEFITAVPGARTAIAVKSGGLHARDLYLLFAWYDDARHRRTVDRLLLVTPHAPSEADRRRFEETFETDAAAQWIALDQLPRLLDIPDHIDFTCPQTLDRLRAASGIRKAGAPQPDHGLGGVVEEPGARRDLATDLKLPRSLTRQLSLKSLIDIERTGRPPEKALRIGQELRPYVLLSDLKSFSTLVRVGDADVIQEMMGAYYRSARDIIWAHGATLDKFIGDSVLAIWGYPEATRHDVSNAVRAAAELIALGRSLLDEFQARHNEVIHSGTRVGIARDEVFVLNIGGDDAELSFVGNAINLAARLEAACDVDGVLIDNRTDAALAGADADLHRLAAAREVVLAEHDVKGQLTDIRAWQITPDGVERILRAHDLGADLARGGDAGLRERPGRSS